MVTAAELTRNQTWLGPRVDARRTLFLAQMASFSLTNSRYLTSLVRRATLVDESGNIAFKDGWTHEDVNRSMQAWMQWLLAVSHSVRRLLFGEVVGDGSGGRRLCPCSASRS